MELSDVLWILWPTHVLIVSTRLWCVNQASIWKDYLAANIWHVQIAPNPTNGLTKLSAVDTLQLRGIDRERFIRKLGEISPASMEEIVLAIAGIIEYP